MAVSIVAVTPRMFAHVLREFGRENTKAALTKMTTRPWTRHINATVTAIRQLPALFSVFRGSTVSRGKKIRYSIRLGGVSQYSSNASTCLHNTEACPLHSHLRNTQQTRCALKCAHSLTTRDIRARCWEHEYGREGICSRRRSQQDEVR